MRFVLCDDDEMFRSLVESICERLGHEVIGVADSTVAATGLVQHAKPDVVVIDLSLGFNTDFDVVATAGEVGARVVIFSYQADDELLSRYEVRPIVVPKPDFAALEQTLANLDHASSDEATAEADRRHRAARAALGPEPTGLTDAQAFYEAMNNAIEGDALVQIDIVDESVAWASIAAEVHDVVRATDRVLGSPASVKVLLAGAEFDGAQSFVRRLGDRAHLPGNARVRSVVLGAAESATEAFDRLRDLP